MEPAAPSSICRCPWVNLSRSDYVAYHDREWGVPVFADRIIFEFLILEAAQAGLSWYTILRKREGYRCAFADFDPEKVARFSPATVLALLQNPAIVRNRAKIEAAVNNAARFLEVQEEFGSFATYLWQFVGGEPVVHSLHTPADYPATSPEAEAMARDLRQRGFRFLGPKVCYAHMQATGMVNDHVIGCFRREEILDVSRQRRFAKGLGSG